MVKKKFSFFKENYSKALKDLNKSKNFVWYAFILFILSGFIGFIFPTPEFIRIYLIEMIENLTSQIEGLNLFEITSYIFFNNLKTSFLSVILGILFGIFPLAVVLINGYLLGFVSKFVVGQEGFIILWRLLPHGIFEIPAVLISIGLGLKLGFSVLKFRKWEDVKKELIKILRIFGFIVFPLLFFAAIIEGFLISLF